MCWYFVFCSCFIIFLGGSFFLYCISLVRGSFSLCVSTLGLFVCFSFMLYLCLGVALVRESFLLCVYTLGLSVCLSFMLYLCLGVAFKGLESQDWFRVAFRCVIYSSSLYFYLVSIIFRIYEIYFVLYLLYLWAF